MPMAHPRNLLRQPAGKKQAWQDLLELKSWLRNRHIKEN
jgi:uracil-DNA glycosylase